jgi:hypothetical protein
VKFEQFRKWQNLTQMIFVLNYIAVSKDSYTVFLAKLCNRFLSYFQGDGY